MQLNTREDIEAPIDFVFAQVTDFHAFERQALRRGANVRRRDSQVPPAQGAAWDVAFEYRGKERPLTAEITRYEAPNGYVITVNSGGITGATTVELVALSRHRTRLNVNTDWAAQGLTARLLLQSLKLARANLLHRLTSRVSSFASDIEERFTRRS